MGKQKAICFRSTVTFPAKIKQCPSYQHQVVRPPCLLSSPISYNPSLRLVLLLIATFSIHFVILSLLSAGLWWSINWFVSELRTAQAAEDEKKRAFDEAKHTDDTDTDAETVIGTGNIHSGSKEVEIFEENGELKDRGSTKGSKSETSTEDEWERVSENEKDK